MGEQAVLKRSLVVLPAYGMKTPPMCNRERELSNANLPQVRGVTCVTNVSTVHAN